MSVVDDEFARTLGRRHRGDERIVLLRRVQCAVERRRVAFIRSAVKRGYVFRRLCV